ncbi:MAG TPA: LacI family DNA-binding transcriptional regulator [Anaerolineae bacterium]|nr:LacI family DNA-binding transcriptional regulator [Anaerolineae bacterium]
MATKRVTPTIRDVAQLAGLSEATVSYVINNGPRSVTPETRAKVLRVMEDLDYHPNASARRLARQRTDTLGIVLAGLTDSNFASSYFLEYIRGISYAAERHERNLMLLTHHHQAQDVTFYSNVRRSRLVDGLLLLGSSIPDQVVVELKARDFPTVLIARRIPGHEVYCVTQNYEESAYQATQHLIARGYKRIGLLGQSQQFNYGVERLAGYRRALAHANIAYDPELVRIPETPRDDPTPQEIATLLRAAPDALLTDREMAVLRTLRELGMRVPEDIALVGLDESESASLLDVPLTTVRPPKFELGVNAVELLLQLIRGEEPESSVIVLPMELMIRSSSPQK